MLKPSKKAGGSPLVAEGKSHGAGAPKTHPNSPLSTKNRVIVTGAKGARHKTTFGAPRKGDDMNPASCGYMKVK